MATRFPLRRLLLVIGTAAAIAIAPTAGGQPLDADTSGEVPGITYGDVPNVISGGPVPKVYGVPCVGGHLGTCLGFVRNNPPHANPIPRAAIGHSPTVRG